MTHTQALHSRPAAMATTTALIPALLILILWSFGPAIESQPVFRPMYAWLDSDPIQDGVSILFKHLNGRRNTSSESEEICRGEGGTGLMIFNASDASNEMQILSTLMIMDDIWLSVDPIPTASMTSPSRLRYKWKKPAIHATALPDSLFWSREQDASKELQLASRNSDACYSLLYDHYRKILKERPCDEVHGVICRIELSSLTTINTVINNAIRDMATQSKANQGDTLTEIVPKLMQLMLKKIAEHEQKLGTKISTPATGTGTAVTDASPKTGIDDSEDMKVQMNDLMESMDDRTSHAILVAYISAVFSFAVLAIFLIILICLLIRRPQIFSKKESKKNVNSTEVKQPPPPVVVSYTKKAAEFEDAPLDLDDKNLEPLLLHQQQQQRYGHAINVPSPQVPANNNTSGPANNPAYRTVSV